MKKKEFCANGKLLISGEYLVLKGARALAIPLKFGQDLKIETKKPVNKAILYWKAYEKKTLWFEIMLSLPDFGLIESSDRLIADKLIQILKTAHKRNSAFIDESKSYLVSSRMTFNKDWGLGSSSTLIKNIADWANIDPYFLLKESFGGSGYDIACASSEKPLFFKLTEGRPQIETVNFDPIFKENLYFVYLGKKQNSAESIKQFKLQDKHSEKFISEISDLSLKMVQAKYLSEFQELMLRHEEIISKVLNKKRIKEERFSDFSGEMKSLGGWGGDFILVATEQNYESVRSYFLNKNLDVIFRFNEMIK